MKTNYKNKLFLTKRKAFTLIELLIVIAIIGILFIVLVSKVDFATDKAKATGVQTDFRSFQVAIESVAKENAGLATFGWDTGDANGDRIRNSYDKGDTNKNGKQDPGEVFVGSKAYGETWTNVYTLANPADADDKSAIIALEEAINKNLDPKLHITINDDLTIIMANGAKDPWDTEYHGYYITNAEVDNKDRGAIVMYSNGANQEFGSNHSISNGVVTVNVPGNNIYGKDDYGLSVVYTYANGYGEVKTTTTGFGNNHGGGQAGTDGTFVPGDQDPQLKEPGLYNDEGFTPWADLLSSGMIEVQNNMINSADCETLIGELVIDSSIKIINDSAFSDCEYLESVFIPSSVTHLNFEAFAYCYGLQNVTFGKNSKLQLVGEWAFQECTSLVNIKIPSGVKLIRNGAFYECTSLETIDIPNGVVDIGESAFEYCTSLKSIVIPNSVIDIHNCTFMYCENLTDVTLSENLTQFDQCIFYGCTSLSNINLPDKLTYIQPNAFEDTAIYDNPDNWENGVLYIDNYLIEASESLSGNYTIREGTIGIAYAAFYNCKNLVNLTVPDSILSVSNGAFNNCNSLTYNEYDNAYYLGNNTNPYLILVKAKNTSIVSCDIHQNTRVIAYNAFKNCQSLENITIPNNVKMIGNAAFVSCKSIKNIEIPNGVISIDDSAFSGCTSVTSIMLPDSLIFIGDSAFSRTAITNLSLPSNVKIIGACAFRYCDNLTNVSINCNVPIIDNYLFEDCASLTSATISGNVYVIYACVFRDCDNFQSITIGNNIIEISSSAFYGCNNLSDIYVSCNKGDIAENTPGWSAENATVHYNNTP